MELTKRIELMENFTNKFKESGHLPKSTREVVCMETIFPHVFTLPLDKDWFAGRFIMLPVGHGLEWAHLGGGDIKMDHKDLTTYNGSSVPELNSAGPSYYGLVEQLAGMKENTNDSVLKKRLDDLIRFWNVEDTHQQMVKEFSKTHDSSLYDSDINNFLPPVLVLTRLSGIELDYELLLNKGLSGLKEQLLIRFKEVNNPEEKDFFEAGLRSISLVEKSIGYYIDQMEMIINEDKGSKEMNRVKVILSSMKDLLSGKPTSFHSAIQLMFLYSQLSGVVNYGRMDDYLGDFLVEDIETGVIDENKAIEYIESMWHLIDECCNRGNGRVIIGGRGRKNPESANLFAELAIKATMKTMTVKPQLTFRKDESTTEVLYDLALDAIGKGCTFPILYNDELNVPSVEKAMGVTANDSKHYVPYGCGEYIIYGRGTGSPNVCVNFTKVLQLAFNKGIDPFDGVYRGGDFQFKELNEFDNYSEVEEYYYDYLDYVLMTTLHYQEDSYQYMAKRSSFLMASLLMHDCIGRGKPILDGGIRYYSGVNEFYGFTNAIDSLQSIKSLVYDEVKYSLEKFVGLVLEENGDSELENRIKAVHKYGNDYDDVDEIAVRLHEHACSYIRSHAKDLGLHSFLAVNINNNANTRWGLKTGASFDGRVSKEHLAPGNNPHSGRDDQGITAMLNSISKLRADIHGGYVQNLKCSPKLFNQERSKVKMLFKGYFKQPGGTQLMVNVLDQNTLIDAKSKPEKYPNLIVRCGGFSAKFVELDRATQTEIINRTCN